MLCSANEKCNIALHLENQSEFTLDLLHLSLAVRRIVCRGLQIYWVACSVCGSCIFVPGDLRGLCHGNGKRSGFW